MHLYLVTWKAEHSNKMEAFKAFSKMTAADDAATEKAYGVRHSIRVHNPSDGSGVAIVEAASVEPVYASILNWAPFLCGSVTEVLDDAAARKIFGAYFEQNSNTK